MEKRYVSLLEERIAQLELLVKGSSPPKSNAETSQTNGSIDKSQEGQKEQSEAKIDKGVEKTESAQSDKVRLLPSSNDRGAGLSLIAMSSSYGATARENTRKRISEKETRARKEKARRHSCSGKWIRPRPRIGIAKSISKVKVSVSS